MNERLLFPELNLFKKQIMERFILVTQEIYQNHPVYTYTDDDEQSKILIYPSYAGVEFPGKQPIITMKMGGYDVGFMDSFNYNMSKEYVDDAGVYRGSEYSKPLSTSIMILIRAFAEEEANDIADELAMLLTFACRDLYSKVGIIIGGARVSETDEAERNQGIFQTTITVPIEAIWRGTIVDTTDPIDPEIDVELVTTHDTSEYDSPGIRVWKESLEK